MNRSFAPRSTDKILSNRLQDKGDQANVLYSEEFNFEETIESEACWLTRNFSYKMPGLF